MVVVTPNHSPPPPLFALSIPPKRNFCLLEFFSFSCPLTKKIVTFSFVGQRIQLRVEKERLLIKVLVKQICVYVYFFFFNFLYSLLCSLRFFAVLFNSLFIESRMNTCRFFFRSFLGEVGSWSDLCFREIYSSIIFYWFIGSRDELFLICHQFLSYIHFIVFNTLW